MDRKTAANILKQPATPLPKEQRTYRTHPDKLAPYWAEIVDLLKQDPKLKAYALFDEMLRRHPEGFQKSWKRTLERRVRDWKIEQRIEKDVTFDQVHTPGDVLAIDFTNMNDLGVTIRNEKFDHLIFHAVLTYSNWEFIDLCFSESFEALARGIQGCFLVIGGVTERIRNDSMTAAVNNLSSDRHFTNNFKQLLDHFQVRCHRINVRTPRENGDCESLHGHFKDYVDQRLRLRGYRDFPSREDWIAFLQECVRHKNLSRESDFRREQEALAELPNRSFPVYTEQECPVASNAIITVKQNRYSVPSCFIGSRVLARIYADEVQVFHAAKYQFTMPRLVGKKQACIDYRDVIDSLVRKPHAFAQYQYQEHMFPSIDFRQAFDTLTDSLGEANATRVYLRLLHVTKYEGTAAVEDFVQKLQSPCADMSKKSLHAKLDAIQCAVPAMVTDDVHVETPDLDGYDELLKHKEVLNESELESCCPVEDRGDAPIGTGFPFEMPSASDDAIDGREPIGTSSCGELDSLEVPERTDSSGMRDAESQSNPSRAQEIRAGAEQDLGSGRMGTPTTDDSPTDGPTAQRRIPERGEQSSDLWQARHGEDIASQCAWRCTCTSRSYGLYGTLCEVGATSLVGQEGVAVAPVTDEAWEVLRVSVGTSPWGHTP
jgi:transposase